MWWIVERLSSASEAFMSRSGISLESKPLEEESSVGWVGIYWDAGPFVDGAAEVAQGPGDDR